MQKRNRLFICLSALTYVAVYIFTYVSAYHWKIERRIYKSKFKAG